MYSWAYFSSLNNGWYCKVCEEYSVTGDDYWKTKARKHDRHPTEFFTGHLMSGKHQEAVSRRQNTRNMLKKGNIVAQITTGSQNQQMETRLRNRRVIKKFIKTVYFMSRKKWAVKNNFADLVDFIRDLGDDDFKSHFNAMTKNATYMSHFTVDEFVKILSGYIETSFLRDLLSSGDFALLTDESTDEAGRAQLSIFVRYNDITTKAPSEKFVCLRKLGTSKTSAAIMSELEEMFMDKKIDKTMIRFSGLDGTNAMSGAQKGLQRRLQHVSPYALYLNCRNHRLALCLVHLLKQYKELEVLDVLLLSLWKIFKFSTVKQAVFENAQTLRDLPPLKILKACTTRWLTHGDTSVRVISRFKAVVESLDTIFIEKRDPEAKGIRDQLLSPNLIMMLLLLAEVLAPINLFCKFLQTRNLNYSLVMNRYQRVINKLEAIKYGLDDHNSVGTSLKYFKQVCSFIFLL